VRECCWIYLLSRGLVTFHVLLDGYVHTWDWNGKWEGKGESCSLKGKGKELRKWRKKTSER
jgi:hypothetical protein